MKWRIVVACLSGSVLVPSSPAIASAAQNSDKSLTFEVSSIHQTPPEEAGAIQMMKPLPLGTGYMVQNMTVKAMMMTAYRLPLNRIEGGPDWLDTARYDVEAKADKSYGIEDLHTMFKNLLADRFGLKFHIETREASVYNLVVDKDGPKMKPDEPSREIQIPIVPRDSPGDFLGTKVPMSYLAFFISQQILGSERPVIDKTGLSQVYDFTLTFIPEFPGVPTDKLAPELQNRPTLFDALREQLGLRLVPAKGPVETYVVDSAQRPTAN